MFGTTFFTFPRSIFCYIGFIWISKLAKIVLISELLRYTFRFSQILVRNSSSFDEKNVKSSLCQKPGLLCWKTYENRVSWMSRPSDFRSEAFYAHTWIHTYIHMYVCTYVKTYEHTHVRMFLLLLLLLLFLLLFFLFTHIRMYVCNYKAYIYTCANTYIRTYVLACVRTSIRLLWLLWLI